MKTYRPSDEVDFVIVGSGAAGGVMAHELARSGFSVVVLEQGPWLTEKDFSHESDAVYVPPEKRVSYNPLTTRRANESENEHGSSGDAGHCIYVISSSIGGLHL